MINFSHKNNEDCNRNINQIHNIKRKDMINKCFPLVDIISSSINILNFEKKFYIYYNENNDKNDTYYIDMDFNFNLYKNTNIKFENINVLENIIKNINYSLIIPNLEINIPLYYFFTNNNNNIFNIFITAFNLYNKKLEKTIQIINNNFINSFFSIYKDTNKFVKFSFNFNLFNIALLSNKFFDIIPLFSDSFNNHKIKEKLQEIFINFNLVNIYNIIEYKSNITYVSKDDILYYNYFINQKFKNNSDEFIKCSKKYVGSMSG
jgi:hypothetical protein